MPVGDWALSQTLRICSCLESLRASRLSQAANASLAFREYTKSQKKEHRKHLKHKKLTTHNPKPQTKPAEQKTQKPAQKPLRDTKITPENTAEYLHPKPGKPYPYNLRKTPRQPFITPKNNHTTIRKNAVGTDRISVSCNQT